MIDPLAILVVDDEAGHRDVLSRRLTRRGYTVATAASGAECLVHLARQPVAMVLLDIHMPVMSGFEVLQAIRANAAMARLPVLMMAEADRNDDIVMALELGADDYLTRPIDFPVAFARIRTQFLRRAAEERLRESEERYALAAQGANDGLWDWKVAGGEVRYSDRWTAIIGHRHDEIGAGIEEWLDRVHPEDAVRVRADLDAHVSGATPHFESEHRIKHRNGTFRWVLARGLATRNAQGVVTRMAGSLSDITDGKVLDALTGLPNRTLLRDRLWWALERSGAHDHEPFAVLFLDLDGFKEVNDTLGHQAGDALLKAVSSRIEMSLRSTDVVTRIDGHDDSASAMQHTLARVGGDEFVILLHHVGGVMNATRVADRIHQSLARPVLVAGREVFTSASIGITISQGGGRGPDELLRDADTAMYRAKALGKGRTEVFDVAMREQVVRQMLLDAAVRRGFERREFVPHYQPLVDLGTGLIVGFEALIRWQHPEQGLVPASQFLPMLQENGLAQPVGQQFIHDVCRHLREWTSSGGRAAALWANVNFSSRELLDENLTARLLECLDDHALDPRHLMVEIAEQAVIDDFARVSRIVGKLHEAGIRVVLDDFGTGYSSLTCLHELPLSGLKLDPSFALGTARRMEIVKAVISLACNLDLTVTAEGLETVEACEQVQTLGCHYGQGYLFSPALPPDLAALALQADSACDWKMRRPA